MTMTMTTTMTMTVVDELKSVVDQDSDGVCKV